MMQEMKKVTLVTPTLKTKISRTTNLREKCSVTSVTSVTRWELRDMIQGSSVTWCHKCHRKEAI